MRSLNTYKAQNDQHYRNYKGSYTNLICRMCNATYETKKHVSKEGTSIHQDETTKYFTDNINILLETVKKTNHTNQVRTE